MYVTCRNKMHQSKAWVNWKVFSYAENTSKNWALQNCLCKVWSERLNVTRNLLEYLWDTLFTFWKTPHYCPKHVFYKRIRKRSYFSWML